MFKAIIAATIITSTLLQLDVPQHQVVPSKHKTSVYYKIKIGPSHILVQQNIRLTQAHVMLPVFNSVQIYV